jgi:mono/diheme cytochrome c family protein
MNDVDRTTSGASPRSHGRPVPGIVLAAALLTLFGSLAVGQSDSGVDAQPLEYEKWKTNYPGTYHDYNRRANLVQRGYDVYNRYCVGCHGENGDGDGPATQRLITKPRDFTSGIYKFRSTDSGSLPLEADLYRTITRGLAQVSMPAFPLMPDRDKVAVVEYIKGFYPRWEQEKGMRKIVPVPAAPNDLADDVRARRGRIVYLEMQCNKCHGIDGQGTGATQTEYVDAWGEKQKPFNFTRGALKGGNAPADIYRTFQTGLQSVMPAFGVDILALAAQESFESSTESLPQADVDRLREVIDQFPATAGEAFEMSDSDRLELGQRNSWDLVSYILSLRTSQTTAEALFGSGTATNR